MSAAFEEELADRGIDMEEDKGVDFQSLRARFQTDDSLKIRIKPAIPEKPKTLTSPTTKISNPLVSSINSAMEHRMPFTPRVVFKDEKKSTVKRQLSQPEALHPKVQDTRVNPESVDNKQKKEGILVKQALKDKNLPLVLPVNPVTPVIDETPKPDPGPDSPASASPSKASTPKRKSFFNFSKPAKAEKEKTEFSKCTVPVSPELDSLAPSNSTPISSTPILNKVVAPKALVPPVQADVVPPSSSPIPIIPEPEVPVPTVPEPDIVSQICPEVENLKPDVPMTHDITVTLPEPDDNLPEEMAHSPEIPDILDMDIPPPIIPEEDDADISALDILAPVTPDRPISALSASYTVSSTPNHSRTASPALSASASVTPEPSVNMVPQTITPNSDAASSPRSSPTMPSAAINVKPVAENGTAESREGVDPSEETPEVHSSTSSQPISALSVLARAEEMAPIRHNSCDQRVLNLLEKAKRKHNVNNQTPPPTTPETGEMISLDTTSPAFTTPEASTSENSQLEAAQAEPVPTVEAAPLPQQPAVDLPDIPPVDYEEQPVESNSPSSETALTNGHVTNRASPVPNVLVEQKPRAKAKPPPPPPRKTPVTIPNGSITSEKPTSTDLQTSTLPDQPVEVIIIPAPVDFTSEDSMFNDSECDDSSEAVALEDPQAKLPELRNSAFSVHEQAFLEQLSPEHQRSLETTETDFAQMASGVPDSVPESPAIPSPSGTLEMKYNDGNEIYEDLAANKKSKNAKKQRNVAPMNPYGDSPAVNEDHSRKTLFAKKNASPDEKDRKKKEKQKEKEKEKERKGQKEKEKEKKEQKEKEKDKKEQKEKEHKEKEKEKKELKEKEHKEKEKEKKELKDKEKEKKEQKDKEREKKEQKEKEREKKEQKEKEKKENEMKKKFKIKGDEEAMYQVRVRETCKGRKNDLAVKAGETVSIIRTTDCPKGKWLARDSNNKYGYIPVESVELNVQEMMEFGKKAKVSSRPNSSVFTDPDVTSTGSRSSNQYISNQESFTDDSEEWCDDDDAVFTPRDSTNLDLNHISSPETVSPEADPANQAQTDGDDNVQARHEALQKLATFFAQPKVPDHTTLNRNTIIEEPEPEEPESIGKHDVDLQILPPPDLYADLVVGDSEGIYCN